MTCRREAAKTRASRSTLLNKASLERDRFAMVIFSWSVCLLHKLL